MASGTNNQIVGKQVFFTKNTEFNIDANFEFKSCILVFEEGAKIQVGAGKQFTITGSTLRGACPTTNGRTLWDGIYASASNPPFAQTTVEIANSFIYDMNNGIVLTSGPKFLCTGNKFYDNRESIVFNGGDYTNAPSTTLNITNNEFRTVNGLVNTPTGGNPTARRGIDVADCINLTIGALSANGGNVFDSLQTGIRTYLTNAGVTSETKVYNGKFSRMNQFPDSVLFATRINNGD